VIRSALAFVAVVALSAPALAQSIEYRVLATSRTSTMEKELNEAGAAGFKYVTVMGGETAAGGKEVVVLLQKGGDTPEGKFRYKLLATNRTSTMQREMNDAAADGYDYVGQTVFESLFGGEEVVSIVERGTAVESAFVYRLVATMRTSTLQKELNQLGADGYQSLGMTVGKTALGGRELVVISRKKR
jgi:hypothetical protein